MRGTTAPWHPLAFVFFHVPRESRAVVLFDDRSFARCLRCCCALARSSSGSFMRRKGALILVASLRRYGAGESKDAVVTKEACAALRSVTLGDDRRKDFSGIRRRDRRAATESISVFELSCVLPYENITLGSKESQRIAILHYLSQVSHSCLGLERRYGGRFCFVFGGRTRKNEPSGQLPLSRVRRNPFSSAVRWRRGKPQLHVEACDFFPPRRYC